MAGRRLILKDLWWSLALGIGGLLGHIAGEEQTLAYSPRQQEQVLTALMAIRRGEVGPFERLEDDFFLRPIGVAEGNDGLVRRWTSLLSQSVAGAPNQEQLVLALQGRWHRLRTIAPNQPYAFFDFPIPETTVLRRQWADQAFDRGDMAAFLALMGSQVGQDPRWALAQKALGLSGHLQSFAGLSEAVATAPPPDPTPFRVAKGHLWCLESTGIPLWRLPVTSETEVHVGRSHAALRSSMRFCTVDVTGKINDLSMPAQVLVLGLSGQYLWLHQGSRAYRVDLERGTHLQINLPDEPLGPPLSVGQDAVWLLKKGLCQSSGASVVQRIRTNRSFQVQQEWRRSGDGPWLQADGRWYRLRPSDGSLADLERTGHEREVVAAFGRLRTPTQTDREILRDALLAVGKASGLEVSQALTLAGVTAQDRLRLAMRYWLDGEVVSEAILQEMQLYPDLLLCVDPAADPRDPPEFWRRALSARSWFEAVATSAAPRKKLAREDLVSGRFPWKETQISGATAKLLQSGPSQDLGWVLSDHESRLRLSRENSRTVVEHFPLSSTALLWRLSIETKALLPSRSIARSGAHFLLAEGQSRMQVISSVDGRLIATWFLPNGSADPGRSAQVNGQTLVTVRPNQSVVDFWSDLGRSQKSIPLPSPALWLVAPVEGVLLIGHEDGHVRLWPEGTPVSWPASVQELVLCDRRYLWIGDKAFALDR